MRHHLTSWETALIDLSGNDLEPGYAVGVLRSAAKLVTGRRAVNRRCLFLANLPRDTATCFDCEVIPLDPVPRKWGVIVCQLEYIPPWLLYSSQANVLLSYLCCTKFFYSSRKG